MQELNGLDYLSPNERQRYIQDQLQQARVERIKASRQQFSNFCKDRLERYSQQKKVHAQKKKKMNKEEKIIKREQAEQISSRLAIARQNFGSAQSNAIDEMLQKQNAQAQSDIEKAEFEKRTNERFQQAMEKVRANDPRIPLQERADTMNNARLTALKRGCAALQQYNRMMNRQKEEDIAMAKASKLQEETILHPKLNISDFAATHFHAGIGIVPTTFEGVKYQSEIEKAAEQEAANAKKRKIDAKKRAQTAAFHHQVSKDTENLAKELKEIHQEEVDEQLTAIKVHPSKELVSAATYNLEDRDKKMQARIQRFLAFNDEAPEPRGEAPQPYPQHPQPHPQQHPIPNSPVQSSDGEDVIDANDDIDNRFLFD